MASEYVLAVFLHALDPAKTAAFCCEHLDFFERSHGDQWVEIENGALTLRVVPWVDNGAAISPVMLELVTDDLTATCRRLSELPGVGSPSEPTQVAPNRIESRLSTSLGLTLVVTRKLTEDDLEGFPDLPTEFVWQPEAVRLVQEMLWLVPLGFREGARGRITALAETLAMSAGEVEVVVKQAREALLQGTPDFQQEALSAALEEYDTSDHHLDLGVSRAKDV